MKDVLEFNKVYGVDSIKSILLSFWGFNITRGVDIEICGCKVVFLL
jgi:hypothetical protein